MSKSLSRLLVFAMAAGFSIHPLIAEAVPALFTHQGRLKDSSGALVSGPHVLTFRLYDAASGGAVQWTLPVAVSLNQGLYTVNLPIPVDTFDGAAYWMSVQVDSDPELTTRMQIASVPYAARAAAADSATVGGGWKDLGAAVALADSTNAVGIGTSSPARALHVMAPAGDLFTSRFESAHPGATITEIKNSSNDVIWEHSVAGSDGAFGGFVPSGSMYFYRQGAPVLAAVLDSNGNTGLGGVPASDARLHVESAGAAYGVHAVASSDSVAYGVYGEAAGGAECYGVAGKANSGTDLRYGVYGEASNADLPITAVGVMGVGGGDGSVGVWGSAVTSTGTVGVYGEGQFGVYGEGEFGLYGFGNTGVYGTAVGFSARAGIFDGIVDINGGLDVSGSVDVSGTLTKGGGAFKIDHPLDPANKYLQHSFVESPDMKNIYDGAAILDVDGRVTVTLPAWFEVLNNEFRYQLTCVGGYAPVYIES